MHRAFQIGLHAQAVFQHERQLVLGIDVALFGEAAQHGGGGFVIAFVDVGKGGVKLQSLRIKAHSGAFGQ